jgi:hypothetical protein
VKFRSVGQELASERCRGSLSAVPSRDRRRPVFDLLTNPYFVPDDAMTDALVRAAGRGVRVSVITAGATQGVLDGLVRKASQAHFARAIKRA